MSPRADSLLGYWIEAESRIRTLKPGLVTGDPGLESPTPTLPMPVAMPVASTGVPGTANALPAIRLSGLSIRAPHGVDHAAMTPDDRMPATPRRPALLSAARRS